MPNLRDPEPLDPLTRSALDANSKVGWLTALWRSPSIQDLAAPEDREPRCRQCGLLEPLHREDCPEVSPNA